MLNTVVNHRVAVSGDDHLYRIVRGRDGQRACFVRHVVVALYGVAGRRDGISANIFARCAAQRVRNHIFIVVILQTANRGSQFGIILPERLILVIGFHRERGTGDGEGSIRRGYLVIWILIQVYGDGEDADRVAGFAGKRVVQGFVTDCARYGGGEFRIGVAVSFALVVSDYRGVLLGDGESAALHVKGVVGVVARSHGDGVGADGVAGIAGEGVVDDVAHHGTRHGGGEFGVGAAVSLALVVGFHRNRSRRDD